MFIDEIKVYARAGHGGKGCVAFQREKFRPKGCLLYTSDAADDLPCVDLRGRRVIKKKKI